MTQRKNTFKASFKLCGQYNVIHTSPTDADERTQSPDYNMPLRYSPTLQTPIQQSTKTSTDQCQQKPTLIRQYQINLSVVVG